MNTYRLAFTDNGQVTGSSGDDDDRVCESLRKYLNVTGKEASIVFNGGETAREIIVLINDRTIEERISGIDAWLGFPVKVVQWYLWRQSP